MLHKEEDESLGGGRKSEREREGAGKIKRIDKKEEEKGNDKK